MTNGVSLVSSNSCPHGESLIGTNYMGRNYTCFEKVFCSGWKANGWIWAARVISILVLPIFLGIAGAHLLSQACSNKNDGGDYPPCSWNNASADAEEDAANGSEDAANGSVDVANGSVDVANGSGSSGASGPGSSGAFFRSNAGPSDAVTIARDNFLQQRGWQHAGNLGEGGFGTVKKYSEGDKTITVKLLDVTDLFGRNSNCYKVRESGVRLERGEALALEFPEHENLLKVERLIVYNTGTDKCRMLDRKNYNGCSNELVVGTISDELVGAKDLEARRQEKLNKEGKPAIIDLSSFTKKIASAIHAMHQKNFAHRDIKPNNILAYKVKDKDKGEVEEYKLIDFGFTRNLEQLPEGKTTTLRGTPEFCAPEMFVYGKKGYDPKKADAWSFGITLFYLAFGVPPLHCLKDDCKTLLKARYDCITKAMPLAGLMDAKTLDKVGPKTLNEDKAHIQKKNEGKKHPYAQDQQLWDLLGKLICPPDKRLTFAEIGQHPFCSRTANAEET